MMGEQSDGENWKLIFYSTSRRQSKYVCVTTGNGTSLFKPQRLPPVAHLLQKDHTNFSHTVVSTEGQVFKYMTL